MTVWVDVDVVVGQMIAAGSIYVNYGKLIVIDMVNADDVDKRRAVSP